MKSTKKMGYLNSILFIIFSITFYQTAFHLSFVAAKDFLIRGDELNSLNSSSTLVSANEMFTMGFLKTTSTNFTYLGIWYTNDEEDRVWVANRNIPIIGSGVLMIDDSGTLKVINGRRATLFIVFNNQGGTRNMTTCVLEDSGNFVVQDNNNQILWKSFDHPTNHLIPGMKIGYNLTTKQNWTLVSSISQQVLGSGSFTLRLEQYKNSPQLLIYAHGGVNWASGPWNSSLGNFQFLTLRGIQHPFDLISDPSGMYVILQTVVSTLQLSPAGRFTRRGRFDTPDFCFGYQFYDGCRAQINSYSFERGDLHGDYSTKDDNSSIGIGDCMERCWKDCTCLGFNTLNSDGTGCITWPVDKTTYNISYDTDDIGQGGLSYILVLVTNKLHKKKSWIRILVPVASVITSVLAAYLCYMRIRRHRIKGLEKRMTVDFIHQLTSSDSFNYEDELEKDIKNAPDVIIFCYKAIETATDYFSDANKLGQGGFGPVYKGKLFDGREIAIKRQSKSSRQGIQEFKSELILASKLQHTNLVRLYGCCIHQQEAMLIYEFMPNKSLDFFLFAEDKKEKIDWEMRFNIIEGVAQGLLYLRNYSRMKIIHRDLKVSNVLLDEKMNPKIADFGMARIFKQDVTEAMTNRISGTYGYMAPEYAMEGIYSIKTDIFSFGVLILEIVSGKKNSSICNLERPVNLVGYAWELWKRQTPLELRDEALGESFDVKQLLRVIHVGLLCVQKNAEDRPTMSKVIYMLNNETADLPKPNKPAFFTDRQVVETRSENDSLDKNCRVSENVLSITTMVAR